MALRLSFLGHAAFHLETATASLLIDPFLSDNPLANASPYDFSPSHIFLTHAHGDHIGDADAIARRSGATIISSFEITNYFAARDLKTHGMNPGGSFAFDFGTVKFTPAWHSSSFPDGSYGGMPMGCVITLAGKRIYHAGDTALFSDMALIGRGGLDVALLPIGDNFTMGPADAVEAAKLLKPAQVVPIHYNTFPPIQQDAQHFKSNLEQNTSAKCVILEPGDSLEL